jgi:hypothetical protein
MFNDIINILNKKHVLLQKITLSLANGHPSLYLKGSLTLFDDISISGCFVNGTLGNTPLLFKIYLSG